MIGEAETKVNLPKYVKLTTTDEEDARKKERRTRTKRTMRKRKRRRVRKRRKTCGGWQEEAKKRVKKIPSPFVLCHIGVLSVRRRKKSRDARGSSGH